MVFVLVGILIFLVGFAVGVAFMCYMGALREAWAMFVRFME